MARKEKEFHPGQPALIMDIKSGIKVQGTIYPIHPSKSALYLNIPITQILVKANGEKAFFDKETLEGKTLYGSCVLMHVKA